MRSLVYRERFEKRQAPPVVGDHGLQEEGRRHGENLDKSSRFPLLSSGLQQRSQCD